MSFVRWLFLLLNFILRIVNFFLLFIYEDMAISFQFDKNLIYTLFIFDWKYQKKNLKILILSQQHQYIECSNKKRDYKVGAASKKGLSIIDMRWWHCIGVKLIFSEYQTRKIHRRAHAN